MITNKQNVEKWFKILRDQICESLEDIESKYQHKEIKKEPGKFSRKRWKRFHIKCF